MDIREYKKALRTKTKKFRRNLALDYKKRLDDSITEIFLSSQIYKECSSVFCYVSTPIEVDTKSIIEKALADGKTVAVPRCIAGTRFMEFIPIKSFEDLEKGSFGVLEPKTELTQRAREDEKTICLIPALMYDSKGYRLGYGGGYYDRFLSRFTGKTIGLIYSQNISKKIFHGRYDVPVSYIVSQSSMRKIPKIQRNID